MTAMRSTCRLVRLPWKATQELYIRIIKVAAMVATRLLRARSRYEVEAAKPAPVTVLGRRRPKAPVGGLRLSGRLLTAERVDRCHSPGCREQKGRANKDNQQRRQKGQDRGSSTGVAAHTHARARTGGQLGVFKRPALTTGETTGPRLGPAGVCLSPCCSCDPK